MSEKLNFVFFGTPDVALKTLQILKENGYLPSFIVTAPDKPQGRKMIVTPSPVKIWAIENKIPFIQPEKLKAKDFYGEQDIPDLFLVVAYGKILSEDILNIPKFGSVNIHYSLLPKYRGASPVETAILHGDIETGVTIQKMKFEMDAGSIISQETTKIFPSEKASELRTRLIKIGGELLLRVLPDFVAGKIKEIEQDESNVTFCKKIKKEDGLIDFNDSAEKNYNKFRAYATWPRTFFFNDRKRIIITDATLENNQFKIRKVLPEGKREIKWEEFNTSR